MRMDVGGLNKDTGYSVTTQRLREEVPQNGDSDLGVLSMRCYLCYLCRDTVRLVPGYV